MVAIAIVHDYILHVSIHLKRFSRKANAMFVVDRETINYAASLITALLPPTGSVHYDQNLRATK